MRRAAALGLWLVLAACESGSAAYKPGPGPYPVASATAEWVDPARFWPDAATHRMVPVKVYAPGPTSPGPFPVVLLSPGLGGSREQLLYLAEHWASHGYIVLVATHPGSDDVTVREVPLDLVRTDPVQRQLRPADLVFLIDRLQRADHGEALLTGRVDLDRIAVAGFSFGAFTALALGGQTFDGGLAFPDPRVAAVVALSPPGPGAYGLAADSWDAVALPALTMMGTRDVSPSTPDPLERRVPFDRMPPGGKLHVTLRDAHHGAFADGSSVYRTWILQATTAFLDANLRDDASALAWLGTDDLEQLSRGRAVLEQKP
ncbi:MAG: alpha/beta hydrolase family protein [Planctomycetota bacterium]|jgi:predicted dienelactone hydrolase